MALGINEAALMIAEGICDRPADMDLAMINGTGFPAYRGGILRYADAWGLKRVYEKLLELEKRYGPRYEPGRSDPGDGGIREDFLFQQKPLWTCQETGGRVIIQMKISVDFS